MSGTMQESPPLANAANAATRRVAASNAASSAFFSDSVDSIARACQAMATRFQRGGRLLVCGDATRESDIAHVVVEFLHPVVVGKRALPAVAVRSPVALQALARSSDILMLFASTAADVADVADVAAVGAAARERGLLTLRLGGARRGGDADFVFSVPSTDPCIVQETHEMLYHVLWELVHVFLDHRGGTR